MLRYSRRIARLTCWGGMRRMIRWLRRSIRKIMGIILGSIRRYSSLSISISRIPRGRRKCLLPTRETDLLKQQIRPSPSSGSLRVCTRLTRSKSSRKSLHLVQQQPNDTNPHQTTFNPSATKAFKAIKTPFVQRTKPLTNPKSHKTASPATTQTGATS